MAESTETAVKKRVVVDVNFGPASEYRFITR